MATIGQRLRQIIDNQPDRLKDFCAKNEIHYTGLIKIMNDERPLGMNVLQQIKNALPNIDTEWLLFGTERVETSKNDNVDYSEVREPSTQYGSADIFVNAVLKCLDNEIVQDRLRVILNGK